MGYEHVFQPYTYTLRIFSIEVWDRLYRRIWCCYKAKSFTKHFLNHWWSEMGLFTLHNKQLLCPTLIWLFKVITWILKVVFLFQSIPFIPLSVTGNRNKGKGNGTGLAWESCSRTALQTSSVSHTHTLLVQTDNMTTVKEFFLEYL